MAKGARARHRFGSHRGHAARQSIPAIPMICAACERSNLFRGEAGFRQSDSEQNARQCESPGFQMPQLKTQATAQAPEVAVQLMDFRATL